MIQRIPTPFLPRSGRTTQVVVGDEGDVQAGHPVPRGSQFVTTSNGLIIDRATGLMWPIYVRDMIPFGTDGQYAEGNNVEIWRGNWATSTTYNVGEGACDAAIQAINVSAATAASNGQSTLTINSGAFTNADVGRHIYIGTSPYRIVQVTDGTHVNVLNASGTPATGAATIIGHFIAKTTHTSGATRPNADTTNWGETFWVNMIGVNGPGDPSSNTPVMQWSGEGDGTIASKEGAVERCWTLTYAGYSDWRLPSLAELHTLDNLEDTSMPTIYAPPFSSGFPVTACNFWSNVPRIGATAAWYYRYDEAAAKMNLGFKTAGQYVLPVRGGRING